MQGSKNQEEELEKRLNSIGKDRIRLGELIEIGVKLRTTTDQADLLVNSFIGEFLGVKVHAGFSSLRGAWLVELMF